MTDTPTGIRIVVADQSQARIYSAGARRLKLLGSLSDPRARLHDRDLGSDRPGRVFDRAVAPGKRRGSVARHSTGGERSPRKHEALTFAQQIVRRLQVTRRTEAFGRLVLVAGPSFLGVLRRVMPKSLQAIVVAEINKDLVHETDSGVLSHVPREVFVFDSNIRLRRRH